MIRLTGPPVESPRLIRRALVGGGRDVAVQHVSKLRVGMPTGASLLAWLPDRRVTYLDGIRRNFSSRMVAIMEEYRVTRRGPENCPLTRP